MYDVIDGDGWSWAVYPGDPAWRTCLQLSRAGFRRLVLPRRLLVSGRVSGVLKAELAAAETALAGLALYDRAPPHSRRLLRQLAERRVRLLECVGAATDADGVRLGEYG